MPIEYRKWYLVFVSPDDDWSEIMDIYIHRSGAVLSEYIRRLHKVYKGSNSYYVVVNETNQVKAYEKAYQLIKEFRRTETLSGVFVEGEDGEERFRFS